MTNSEWLNTRFALALPVIVLASAIGCVGRQSGSEVSGKLNADTDSEPAKEIPVTSPPVSTADAPLDEVVLDIDKLLAKQLPAEKLDEGWVQLFDGQSLFGWLSTGKADWQVVDGSIRVSKGERSYLCTSFQVSDFEMLVDFQCSAETNSGIFLRTGPKPGSVETECLELNIAPTDNPFPTGSFVGRKRLEPSELGELDHDAWHTYRIKVQGANVEVHLDGKQIMSLDDVEVAERGYVSLQHNSGPIAFRNIMMRPLYAESLSVGEDWEADWTKEVKEGATMDVASTDQGLAIEGGLGQLQSKADFGDFWLQAKYSLATPDVNSGIFFRCIRESMLDGYECQVNHSMKDGDPETPGDGGAGAIFRRQNARAVISDGTSPTHVSVLASGNQISTWINGVQVVDFLDTRKLDANPRRGLRTEPGPISLQGHDPTTKAVYHSIQVSSLSKAE
ncbi:MAG: DUF1080 domain-containing protein [Aureliella sp.]